MFRDGTFVAANLDPIDEEQVQPNGVDLKLDSVLEPTGSGQIATDGKSIAEREQVSPEDGAYELTPGPYIAQYRETIAVPEEHIGFVHPRSSLMRNGAMLNTAVWDAGYEGKGEGLLVVHHPITIEAGARIGQFVLAKADHVGTYDGSYQGERL